MAIGLLHRIRTPPMLCRRELSGRTQGFVQPIIGEARRGIFGGPTGEVPAATRCSDARTAGAARPSISPTSEEGRS